MAQLNVTPFHSSSARRAAIAFAAGSLAIVLACKSEERRPSVYPAIAVSTTTLSTVEGGPVASIQVMLATPPSNAVDVRVASTDATEGLVALPGGSGSSSQTLTFTPFDWNVPRTVEIRPVDDTSSDGNQTYAVNVSVSFTTDAVYLQVPMVPIAVTNADNDVPGITVSRTSLSTSETATTDTFTVRLNTAPSATVTIPVASADASEGLVSAGGSPAAPSVNLTFTTSSWNSAQTVTVSGQNDLVADGNQTYTVNVGPATGAAEYAGLPAQPVSVTNADNDVAGITVTPSAAPLLTSENGTSATFTVVLNTQPTADIVVPATSGNTAEGLVSAGGPAAASVNLTFTAASWNVPQTVTVTGQDDLATPVPGDNATYTIAVGPPASGDPAYLALAARAVAVLNVDNDVAAILVPQAGAPLVTSETGTSASFTVFINQAPTTDVVIPVTSADLTEGLVMGGSSPSIPAQTLNVTFTPVDWQTPQTITVVGQSDVVVDGNQSYAVTVGPATGDGAYSGLSGPSVSVTNSDINVAGFTVSATSITTNEGGTPVAFTVRLNTQPAADVTIPVTTSHPAEALVQSGASGQLAALDLTFNAGNWSTPQTVNVYGQTDHVDDGNRPYTITVGPTSSTDSHYEGLASRGVGGTSVDVDTAGFTVAPSSGLVVSETGTTATFSVQLNTIPLATVTIPVSVNDTSEAFVAAGTPTPGYRTLTFTASDWNTPHVVTVTGADDALLDGTHSWTVSVGPTASGDSRYQGLAARTVTGSTTDDEVGLSEGTPGAPVAVSAIPYTGQVGNGTSYYVVTGLSGNQVVSLTNVTADVSLAVYSNADFTTGLLCQSNNVGATASEACSLAAPLSGTIYIRVGCTAVSGAGYVLNVAPIDLNVETEPNNSPASANGPYVANWLISGSISTTTDVDYFAVNNSSGTSRSVTFETFTGSVGSCSWDTVLELRTAADAMLTSDDDSGVGLCSRLTYTIPAAATYYIKVRSYASAYTGSYLLQITGL